MRIISKFKDYYDAVWYNTGQGDVFLRETKMVQYSPYNQKYLEMGHELRDFFWDLDRHYSKTKPSYTIDYSILFFCGEVHVLEYKYEINQERQNIDKIIDKSRVNYIRPRDITVEKSIWRTTRAIDIPDNIVEKLHIDLQSPIILYDRCFEVSGKDMYRVHNYFKINQNLSHIHFGKVYSPDTAFQMIEMYNSNFLFKKDDAIVPVGDDKTRIIAAGFDLKTSFRKSKS